MAILIRRIQQCVFFRPWVSRHSDWCKMKILSILVVILYSTDTSYQIVWLLGAWASYLIAPIATRGWVLGYSGANCSLLRSRREHRFCAWNRVNKSYPAKVTCSVRISNFHIPLGDEYPEYDLDHSRSIPSSGARWELSQQSILDFHLDIALGDSFLSQKTTCHADFPVPQSCQWDRLTISENLSGSGDRNPSSRGAAPERLCSSTSGGTNRKPWNSSTCDQLSGSRFIARTAEQIHWPTLTFVPSNNSKGFVALRRVLTILAV